MNHHHLSRTQRRVYQAFKDNPGSTTHHIAEKLHLTPNQVSPRVIELLRMGLLQPMGTTTGRKNRPAQTYRVIEGNDEP